MGDFLQQLENNEAVLLMYLAGELPDEDRAEVERMLASDGGLRATLAELSALRDEVGDVLSAAGADGPASRRDAAVRRVSRAMVARRLEVAQALASDSAATTAAASHRRIRIAWWMYPVAAAAILMVMMYLFSDGRPLNLPAPNNAPDQQFVDNSLSPRILEVTDDAASARLRQVEQQVETEVLSLRTDASLFDAGAETPDLNR